MRKTIVFIILLTSVLFIMSGCKSKEQKYDEIIEEGKDLKKTDPAKAIKLFKEAQKTIPENIDAYLELYKIYVDQEEYDDAEDILEEAEDKVEGSSEAKKIKKKKEELFQKQNENDRESLLNEFSEEYINAHKAPPVPPDSPTSDSSNDNLQIASIYYSYKNEKSQYEAIVCDGADLFSKSEEIDLLKEAFTLTNKFDMYIITIEKNNFGSNESATSQYCKEFCNKYCKNQNCVIFAIDMDTRYLYIFRKGESVEEKLSMNKCDNIVDNIYIYASDRQYYDCASNAIDFIWKLLSQ